MRLYLASRSSRRQELLQQIGVSYELLDVAVDETPGQSEQAADFVLRMALEKAQAGKRQLNNGGGDLILAADTAVVVAGEIMGKPRSQLDAKRMLQRLSAATHRVYTAIALVGSDSRTAVSVSEVAFRAITNAEIDAYWRSGEPADKAGGYAIQGLGALFVQNLHGSYSGVMGLPLFETAQLLKQGGFGLLPNTT